MGVQTADPEASTRTATVIRHLNGVVLAALATGVVVRIQILAGPGGRLDADEAVIGLMARHLLEGEWTTFYWAQEYGGSQEVALAAGAFAIFGASTLVLKTLTIVLHAIAGVLVWLLGRRTVGEPFARVGTALYWIWPAVFLVTSTRARGYYEFGLIAALLVLYLATKIDEEPTLPLVAAFGLSCGLGWWATPQIVLVAVPAVLWLLYRRRELVRKLPIGAIAAAIGAAPWLVHNIRHDWPSLGLTSSPPSGTNTYLDHLDAFFTQGLPAALGLTHVMSDRWIFPAVVGGTLYIAVLIGFAVLALRRKRPSLLVLVMLLCPFLVSLSPFAWFVIEPRYLYFAAPVFALLLARLLSRPIPQAVALVAIASLSVVSVQEWQSDIEAYEASGQSDGLQPGDLDSLIAELQRREVNAVFTDYWNAYRISFASEEEVIATSLGHVRYSPHHDYVRNHEAPAYVFIRGSESESSFSTALSSLGMSAETFEAGLFVVHVPEQRVLPEEL